MYIIMFTRVHNADYVIKAMEEFSMLGLFITSMYRDRDYKLQITKSLLSREKFSSEELQ